MWGVENFFGVLKSKDNTKLRILHNAQNVERKGYGLKNFMYSEEYSKPKEHKINNRKCLIKIQRDKNILNKAKKVLTHKK